MYRNALRKFYEGRNAQLLLYLARWADERGWGHG